MGGGGEGGFPLGILALQNCMPLGIFLNETLTSVALDTLSSRLDVGLCSAPESFEPCIYVCTLQCHLNMLSNGDVNVE